VAFPGVQRATLGKDYPKKGHSDAFLAVGGAKSFFRGTKSMSWGVRRSQSRTGKEAFAFLLGKVSTQHQRREAGSMQDENLEK